MDIRVGAATPIGAATAAKPDLRDHVEARVLATRPARRRGGESQGSVERRKKSDHRDPSGGLIVTLLVPEGHRLPPELDQGGYRVFLRIARR